MWKVVPTLFVLKMWAALCVRHPRSAYGPEPGEPCELRGGSAVQEEAGRVQKEVARASCQVRARFVAG